jgi:hypothetical protein
MIKEMFEDTKGVSRVRISKKNRQHNYQKKKAQKNNQRFTKHNIEQHERYYLNFPIVNFPFICSNIAAAPAYGVYISQLIKYSRGCSSYQDFLDKGLLLTRKVLNQGSSFISSSMG